MTKPMVARLLEEGDGVGAVIENDWARVSLFYLYIDEQQDDRALEFYSHLVDQVNGVGEKPTVVREVVRYRYDWTDRLIFIWIGWAINHVIALVLAYV